MQINVREKFFRTNIYLGLVIRILDVLHYFYWLFWARQASLMLTRFADEKKGQSSIPGGVRRGFSTTPTIELLLVRGLLQLLLAIAFTRPGQLNTERGSDST